MNKYLKHLQDTMLIFKHVTETECRYYLYFCENDERVWDFNTHDLIECMAIKLNIPSGKLISRESTICLVDFKDLWKYHNE